MIEKGIGGGNTITGLNFENESNILSLLEKTDGYSVKDNVIYYKDKEVARSYAKHGLYKYLETRAATIAGLRKYIKAKKGDIDKSLRETFSARMMTMK